MTTTIKQLNDGWNAEPNAPDPAVEIDGSELRLSFLANAFQFPDYDEEDVLRLRFRGCWRYRLGPTNDEGWYTGQCRFGQSIPWGEFYELSGALLADKVSDWTELGSPTASSRHFLFYLRDETFECDAESWDLAKVPNDRS